MPSQDARDAVVENVMNMSELPETERRVWTVTSSTIAATMLMATAWNKQVSSCPIGGYDDEAVLDLIDADSDQYEPIMLITLGYPAENSADQTNARKHCHPVDEIVHFNEFDPVSSTALRSDSTAPSVADD
ncbi:MAG: nitroreductase [Haloquadratum walsbyi J07HQW2]|uniref:Nitroreductase n=2 Tax=Haloquadratum walsbyi TaxID=293091 RepID=U1NFD2_9EURY|nr:MAG: nitroreductase [Haloquadratum walsbyi J07HQW2]